MKNIRFAIMLLVLLTSLGFAGIVAAQGDEEPSPLPEAAIGVQIDPAKGYYVEEASDGLYWITDGSYMMMSLTTGEGVIVVDAPPSMQAFILPAIAEVTDEPITYIVYSHAHADHIGGAAVYPEGVEIIAHEETANALAGINSENRPPYGVFVGGSVVPQPTTTFTDTYTLEVGSQVLELEYRGIQHSEGNLYIYAPQQRVLMVVDIVFPGWSPFVDLAFADNVQGFIATHDDILSYDFEFYIGGHWDRLGTREDVEVQKEYILDIQANSITALQTVDSGAIVQELGANANRYSIPDEYFDALAQTCADLTIPDWIDRLGGVEVYTIDHCFRIFNSVRID